MAASRASPKSMTLEKEAVPLNFKRHLSLCTLPGKREGQGQQPGTWERKDCGDWRWGVGKNAWGGGPWGRPKQAIVHVPAGMHASERGCEQSGPTLQRASLSCPSPAHPVPTQWVFRHPLTQNKLNGRPSHQEFRQGTVGGARERTSSPPPPSSQQAGLGRLQAKGWGPLLRALPTACIWSMRREAVPRRKWKLMLGEGSPKTRFVSSKSALKFTSPFLAQNFSQLPCLLVTQQLSMDKLLRFLKEETRR